MTNAGAAGDFILQGSPNTWAAFSLALSASWVRSWLTSGCAAESLLLIAGPAEHGSVPRFALLAALNVAWLLASTSWLFHIAFATACWPLVVVTCIVQYATASSFTRGRLRAWQKRLHFYKDKIAFFDLPSLVIDTYLDGLVNVRGLTFNILDLSVELHGIEVGLDLGSGHELSIHSDAVTIKLFRQITIDEVYSVHWFTGESPDPEARERRADSHTDSRTNSTHSPEKKRDIIKERFFPSVEESGAASHQEYVKDRVLPRSQDEKIEKRPEVYSPYAVKAGRPSRADVEAEKRYEDVLLGLRQSNRLYQSRARVRIAHGTGEHGHQTDESSDTRAAVCTDLRSTRPPMSPPTGRITVSRLIEIFEPITRLLDKVPVVLRVTLWLFSQSHPITCPSICFSACGEYLGGALSNKLFRHHGATDKRIAALKAEVTNFLSAADIYLDFTRLRGQASVPLRTTSDVRAELSSAEVIITRINPQCEGKESKDNDDNTGRVAQLKGADTSFTIPICLLPSHAYVAPLPDNSDEEDTAPISMAIRAQLPAHFSEALLNFAATLSKTGQMLDIEEEAGLAADDTDHITPRSERLEAEKEEGNTEHPGEHSQGFRAKFSHGRIGAAIKHPLQHGKQILHKEVKKTAVDNIDGAWFAKWTSKLLKKLEGLEGDVGYSTEIPTGIKR